jgi:hypothetical protein
MACGEGEIPAAAPEPQRGRSLERSSPRRGGHVHSSPPRDVAREQDHGSPTRAIDTRCTSGSNIDGRDRSPSPSSQALCVQAARTTPPADSLMLCRAPEQDGREEALRPSFARFKPGRIFTRRPRNDKAQATYAPPENAAIKAPSSVLPAAARFKPGRHYTRRPRGPGGARTQQSCTSAMPHVVDEGIQAEAFISSIARPVSPALLHLPTGGGDARRRHKTSPAQRGVRRSARIATRPWPRGNTVDCARQIL